MAGVRDPAFWKRFSMAVHLDEETMQNGHDFKHSDSWLARQKRKSNRRGIVCWIFWICFLLFVAAVVGVIIWGVQSGVFDGINDNNDSTTKRSIDVMVARSTGPIEQLVDLRGAGGVMGARR